MEPWHVWHIDHPAMRIRSQKHTYVFGVLALGGKKMFETEGAEGQSLKKTLQFKEHIQLWWDIRQHTEAFPESP